MLVTRSDLSKEPCNGTVALPHVHRASARGTWRTIEWHSLAECVPPSVCWKISRWRGCRWTGPKTAQIRGTYTAGHCFIKCYSLLGDIAATPLRRSFAAQPAPCICVQTHISLPCKRNRRPLRDRRNLLPTLLPAAHKPSSLLVWDSR